MYQLLAQIAIAPFGDACHHLFVATGIRGHSKTPTNQKTRKQENKKTRKQENKKTRKQPFGIAHKLDHRYFHEENVNNIHYTAVIKTEYTVSGSETKDFHRPLLLAWVFSAWMGLTNRWKTGVHTG